MDLFSGHFGDVEDDSQFLKAEVQGVSRRGDFDPSQASSKRYLDRLAEAIATTGVRAAHISNNAPRNLADPDDAKRREGIQVAKNWLDAASRIGAISMRCNTGGPRIIPAAQVDPELGYPMNKDVDFARCVGIMTNAGYRGYFAVEYEEQGDGVEGSKKTMEEVPAAL